MVPSGSNLRDTQRDGLAQGDLKGATMAARLHNGVTKLVEEASTPSLDEVLDRAGGRAGGSLTFRDAVKAVHDDRDRR